MAKDFVTMMLVGRELRRVREKAGNSLEDIADCVGRSVGAVNAIERGQVRVTRRYINRVLEGCGRAGLWAPSTMPPADGRTSDY
jgi:transcriptional regulator with XRE-family HTH domain